MLVAILDTGLDLTYTSWGDSANLQTGVRRVHEAFTNDSFRTAEGKENVRYTNASLRRFLEEHQLRATTGSSGQQFTWANNALYKNLKVPFACDYADGDLNVMPMDSNHGTHVAGTVAGYAVDSEGVVKFSGVAPDAQILAMKVFPDDSASGAGESAILNALEDAAVLGADVMNLSLGSDNGFAEDDTAVNDVYERLNAAGIVFMVSAGNSAYSSASNNYGDYNLTSDPEISMMSAPSVYEGNLSVASIDNGIDAQSMLVWNDGEAHKIPFLDSTGIALKSRFATGEEVRVIPVDGYGTYDDYYQAGFRSYYGYGEKGETGVALVKRGGGISFADKINAASQFSWSYYDPSVGYYVTEYPIKAVLIYDEDPTSTELIYMDVSNALLTSAFLNGKDGAALAEAATAARADGGYVTLTVQKEDEIVENSSGGQMSSFSSWGAGPGLELKPEITAPGGNIWSSIVDSGYTASDPSGLYDDYEGSYGMMSGTSMAAPHMTGITALVKQYAMNTLNYDSQTAAALTRQLLVSTAVPQLDSNGVYYSPRLQGAGLVNAAAAVSTPAYITVDGQSIGKLEFKDDPEKNGVYEMAFQVHNLTAFALTYEAKAVLLRPDTGTASTSWGERSVMLDSDVLLREVSLGTVTVPAGESVSFSQTVTLTAEEKGLLNTLFANGAYVEGYVILTSAEESEHPQIGLPFLAYYGDWTAAPVFDSVLWTDTPSDGESVFNNESQWGVSVLGYFDGYSYLNLGQNIFDSSSGTDQITYCPENITISPTGVMKSVNDFVLYQKREAKVMVVEVKDAETGELYYRDYTTYQFKTYYNATYAVAIPSSAYYFTQSNWDGTDLNGNVLPSGTQCIYTITAYGEGEYPTVYNETAGRVVTDVESIIPGETEPTFNGHAMDLTGDVISVPILVDTEAPTLVNSAVSIVERDGRTYLRGTFVDDGSIASVEVFPEIKRTYRQGYGNPDYFEYGVDRNNPFYSEMIYDPDVNTWTFEVDVTEYAHTNESYSGENNVYAYEWTGNVYIYGGDYGGNDRAYGAFVNSEAGLILSTTSARLHVGNSFDLSVINNTGSDAPLTRTSSDPSVATVDEFGHVVAIAPGQTVITVSNGSVAAVCVVVVETYSTEVLNFDLSIDRFSGLKPDGSIVVNVTNLEPADVQITEANWLVYENDPDWAGLLSVSKDSETGLSGRIELTASKYDGGDSAGSGYLEVTLNGVTRKMEFDWEDLYASDDQDGLIPDAYYNEQTVYVPVGETATLIAMYRQNHSFIPVELYTAEGYQMYGSNNPLTACTGLSLDGPGYAANGAEWRGKLVNLPGYKLPENIHVVTRYSDGFESEMTQNAYYGGYTYDSTTGEIVVKNAPYGADNILIIRADGVVDEENPGGTSSGITYTRPEATYGPFDWTFTDGSGDGVIETAEGVTIGYTTKNVAYYTPTEPGVTYITASSKDGTYQVNFAVVAEPVQAESLTLDQRYLTMTVGDSAKLTATLTPTPSLAVDQRLVWTSFDESVATVDEDGNIRAVSPGYAYIKVNIASGVAQMDCCIVQVVACENHSFGAWVQTKAPTCEGAGEESRTCAQCGYTETQPIAALGHDFGEWKLSKDPTCTEAGEETRTCVRCGGAETRAVAALGHDFQVSGTVAPTCTQEGSVTYLCTHCGAEKTETIPAIDCPSLPFGDVEQQVWYHDAVDYMIAREYMNGVSEQCFDVNGTLTRAQLAVILYRVAGSPDTSGLGNPFDDVAEGLWYTDAVKWAAKAGVVQGVATTEFDPMSNITREQIAVMLYRFSQGETAEEDSLSAYPDGASVSDWAREAMNWAVANGYINGVKEAGGKSYLEPQDNATRAQAAVILMRYLTD